MQDIINYISTIDFQSLFLTIKTLYNDFLDLVSIFRGSSTAPLTKSS